MRHLTKKRRGNVAVLVAFSLVAIVGFAAIALDGGMLLDSSRSVQSVADAAALAAADDIFNQYGAGGEGTDSRGTAATSALATAHANGFKNDADADALTDTGDAGKSKVTVNIPPTSGPFSGKAGYAEVIITYYQQRGFSGIFGSSNLPVQARAVARGMRAASGIGILLLDPSAQQSLQMSGSATVKVDGSIIVDSNASNAAVGSGSAGVTSTQLDITGKYVTSGSAYFQASSINTSVSPTTDFLANIPVPDPTKINEYGNAGTMTVRSAATCQPSNGQVLQPGVYVGGISISGGASVSLAPGIYYLQGGGFAMSGGTSLTATGVMIYNGLGANGQAGQLQFSGNGAVTLSPMTTGAYYGMAIFQDRTSTTPISLSGSSSWNLTGTVYGASANVNLSGGSGATMGSQFVADTLTLSGSAALNDIDPSKGYRPRDIRLVE